MELLNSSSKYVDHDICSDAINLKYSIYAQPAAELYLRVGQIEASKKLYNKIIARVIMVGVSTPMWFGLAVVLGISGMKQMATAFAWLIPITPVMVFLMWLGVRFSLFNGIKEEEYEMDAIVKELNRRNHRITVFSTACDN